MFWPIDFVNRRVRVYWILQVFSSCLRILDDFKKYFNT